MLNGNFPSGICAFATLTPFLLVINLFGLVLLVALFAVEGQCLDRVISCVRIARSNL